MFFNDCAARGRVLPYLLFLATTFSTTSGWCAEPAAPALIYADQGIKWTPRARNKFYTQDQGAQLMPLPWLKALKSPDGKPFLDGSLGRYGYLPDPDRDDSGGLPVGFSLASVDGGTMVGLTCAACHTRQIDIDGQPYRVDGGPAIADFERFLADLDAATLTVLDDPTAFKAFASAVIGTDDERDPTVAVLRADLSVWSVRFHTLMSRSLPTERRWGPARLDAVSMILNRVGGLDLGVPPTYVMPGNMMLANAPTRYPFLWNASKQDRTQWPGFAPNGNDLYALSRNLGEVYGVFGLFHPQPTTGSATLFNRNYLVQNSGNFDGLGSLEGLIKRIGPPAWQWKVDVALAARGKTIYQTVKTGPNGGATCEDCHGIKYDYDPLTFLTWQTPVQNVGTDQAEWAVLARPASTGSLDGATVADQTLLERDLALSVLTVSVGGAIAQHEASLVTQHILAAPAPGPFGAALAPAAAVVTGVTVPPGAVVMEAAPGAIGAASPMPTIVARQTATVTSAQLDSLFQLPGRRAEALGGAAGTTVKNAYEARVLQGIWAAAPYLHNGSVPTLADLLKTAALRPTSFAVGPAYDLEKLGLAAEQPGSSFTLKTTGCDADGLASGDSNCGHEYGTQLSDDDKKALLEYMKTL